MMNAKGRNNDESQIGDDLCRALLRVELRFAQ
jgi:hypothetical protein